MLPWILLPFTLYLGITSAYLLAIVLGAWLYRPRGASGHGRARIAVVVPAHDEGERVLTTIRGLFACRYERANLAVIVIADNCTDNTAAVARAAGALVFERVDQTARGKGQALAWLLTTQVEYLRTFDLVAFVDADMFVDAGFLEALDARFADPRVEAVQGQYIVANPEHSWLTAFSFLGFAYVNHVRAAGRCFLGGSCGLKGSGMAFRAGLILKSGWSAGSVAEDAEFSRMLTLRGVRVWYEPLARVSSNIPEAVSSARVQQERWEGGRHSVAMNYLPQVAMELFRRPGAMLLDELLDLLMPPFSIHVAMFLGYVLLAVALGAVSMLVVAGVTGVALLAAVVTSLVQLPMSGKGLRNLALAPVFLLFKWTLLLKLMLRSAPSEWKRTPRDGEGR